MTVRYCPCGRPIGSHDKGPECEKPRMRMVDGVPVEVPLVQTDAPDDGEHAECVSDSGSLEEAMKRAGHTSMSMTSRVYDRGVRDVEPLQ